jgi:4'-phosphopantetheinyl transferase EntD
VPAQGGLACGLASVLPDSVALVEVISRADDTDGGNGPRSSGIGHGEAAARARADMVALPTEEAQALGSAGDRRRREYATGRTCARRALERLGIFSAPVLRGCGGEPVWPPGIVGSITHTAGYVAAAVAQAGQFSALGIDADAHRPLPGGMIRMVSSDQERTWMRALEGDGMCWDAILFSAKESVYKAWFPLTGRWLGFADVTMTVDREAQTFHARLNIPPLELSDRMLSEFDGRFSVGGGLVLTAVTVSAPAAAVASAAAVAAPVLA